MSVAAQRAIQHGTSTGYGRGCRCEACRAAKAALARANGSNRRIGSRGKAKRAWDRAARHPCCDCGRPIGRQAVRCVDCKRRLAASIKLYRRRRIEMLWLQGATLAQIAEEIASTPSAVGVELARMRAEGDWSLPYRRPRRKAVPA